jgi:hypothetical protein
VTVYLNDIGVIGPLGAGKRDVLRSLLAGDGSGLEPYDELLTGRKTMVGRVRVDLPALPPELAELDCRNNRLLACALDSTRCATPSAPRASPSCSARARPASRPARTRPKR